MKAAVLIFGFVHPFGLSTKLQDFALPRPGLVAKDRLARRVMQ